ncbi:MAG: transcriptional repressor [Treponema sp.]|nr:transcriptional repressor [Treponema sp.]
MLQKSYHTKTSDLISQFIQTKMDCGFTAGELSAFLKENGVNVNKTTVYRNLDKMTESGKLLKHKSMISDSFVYQNAEEENNCAEHIHFQCCKCGSVIHLSDKNTTRYLKTLSKELGVQINLNLSSLNGICPRCRRKIQKS